MTIYSPAVERALVDGACQRSLHAFHTLFFAVMNPGKLISQAAYVEAVAHRVQRVFRGDEQRLIITIPPRHGKSEMMISLAAFALGHDPSLKFLYVSYGLDLSQSQTTKLRAILSSPAYQRLFPGTKIKPGADRAGLIETTAGGSWRPASVGSGITGYGANYILIDDMHKADEGVSPGSQNKAMLFYRNTLGSRFDDPASARIIVCQQRLHQRDFVGQLLETGMWPLLSLAAIAVQDERIPIGGGQFWHRSKGDVLDPVRVPQPFLEGRRLEVGLQIFEAQYQQNPMGSDSGVFRWEWLGEYEIAPQRHEFDRVIQAWDTAASLAPDASFSVGMMWGRCRGEWYLLDLIRERMLFPDLRDRVIAWHRQWQADALSIEAASSGDALYQEACRAGLPGLIRSYPPRGSKLDRLAACSTLLAEGTFLVPANSLMVAELRQELLAFPDGYYDDQVDCLSQFLDFLKLNPKMLDGYYDESGRLRYRRSSSKSRAQSYRHAATRR